MVLLYIILLSQSFQEPINNTSEDLLHINMHINNMYFSSVPKIGT